MRKRTEKTRLVKFYLNEHDSKSYIEVPTVYARTPVSITLLISQLKKSTRGYSWNCWIARVNNGCGDGRPDTIPASGAICVCDTLSPLHCYRTFQERWSGNEGNRIRA